MTTITTTAAGRMPPQVPYIIGNEACERFSFYGMRNILTPFLVTSLLLGRRSGRSSIRRPPPGCCRAARW